MAEAGEDYSSEDDSDVPLFDSDTDEASDADEFDGELQFKDDGEKLDEENEIEMESETETPNMEDTEPEKQTEERTEAGDKTQKKPGKRVLNIHKFVFFVNEVFYREQVWPQHVNILTDFADAEIFMIDGDSLLLELLGEQSLDWSNGGQFLHLTYLLERFLQYFTDKGGVFHLVFFQDMEIIWARWPSILLARQAIILHLQHNTTFTVITSINNFWEKEWKEYVDDKIPAFLLMTDAENIPWENSGVKTGELEFFFRSLLLHSLGYGLNCVFIAGIEMTATKVMGYYIESVHKMYYRKNQEPLFKTWHFLMNCLRKEASGVGLDCSLDFPSSQIDVKEKVKNAFQSPPQGGCRELATLLACEMILCTVQNKLTNESTDFRERKLESTEDRIKLFLLHSVLLKKLPLKYRAHTINANLLDQFCKQEDGEGYPFQEIHKYLLEVLKVIWDEYPSMKAAGHSLDMTSVADLMDGRLVHTLFSLALDQRSMDMEAFSLPEDVIEELERLWSKVAAAVNTTEHSVVLRSHFLPIFAGRVTSLPRKEGESSTPEACMRLRQLLGVEHVLVKEYAGDIRSKINAMAESESGEEKLLNNGREFDERYHWHSLKPLSDDYDNAKKLITEKPPDDFRQRRRFFKDKQMFSRFHRLYGNSLTGGVDQAKIITVTDCNPKKKKQETKKGKVSKKAVKIIEENEQKRREQEQQKDQEKWSRILVEIDKTLKQNNYSGALQLVDKFQSDCKSSVFGLQALMKKAQSSLDAWQDMRSQDAQFSDMKYPVLVMECVQKIVNGFNAVVTEKDKKKLAVFMQKLGFDDISATFYDLSQEKKEKKVGQLSVHTTSARFQLEHMGHLLKRDDRTDPDPRVDPKHFIPDTWQRELLDAVDHNESALIVAPTSSGKTYASYYCMEKVLRESDDGIVVYVSPTKALVNQVAATIYARFHRKHLPPGRAVYGVFTRDYQYNTLNSQILVTVPQCLEILFLSPRGQGWTKNIKYVIFDEVHCLGQEIGAEVWEHLLLLIRCPFLALSATVGNPSDLFDWLQAAQDFRRKQDKQGKIEQKKSYRVRLVMCKERYSDLEKSIYLPSPSNGRISEETGKCVDYDVTSTEEFVRLHPCAQLVTKQLRENGFPSDMTLTPRETLELYDVMVEHWPEKESLQRLSPEQYFSENKFIHKTHAREYEKEIKKEFKSWADGNQLEKVVQVIQSLNAICLEKMSSTEEGWNKLRKDSSGDSFVYRNFSKLVEQLKAQDKLPALVFSYNRKLCEALAYGITRDFERREEAKRESTRKSDEKRRLQHEKKVKRTRDEKENGKRSNSQRGKLEEQQDEDEDFSHLNEPLSDCTLTFTHGIGNQGLKKIMDRIKRIASQHPFKRELIRGVSFHHAGLDNKRRSVVEMLFREKYLQVVAATGTLALGIHMPCKTVVFAGDSPFLNSLQYRQMSGRAGRRGFDPVGNVVFFGVPYRKVQRLITANIPNLVGNFPINVTFVLRLLLLTSKGNDKKDAFIKSLALLSHPFICRKYPEMENQIKKHFLFSVELLARLGLINKDSGTPQEMAGLAVHLHYHEPSNFVLVSFLQRGLFHKLCQPGSDGKFPENVMRKMVLVLSHLFKRLYLPANYKRSIDECPTSKVILDDLPDDFKDALQSYNEQVTKVFSQYLTTVAAEHEKERGEENKLPLSEIRFPNYTIEGEGTIKRLGRYAIKYSACSPFTALSGNSDLQLYSRNQTEENEDVEEEEESTEGETVSSLECTERGKTSEEDEDLENEEDEKEFNLEPIDHLLKIIRQDVYTDMNVVPTLPLKKRDSTGRVHRLNAYTLDFFKHGSATVIEKENRIQSGEVFNSLKDFYLNIKSISCSLEELGPEDDNVVLAFKQLAQEYGEKFNKQFGRDI